VAAALPFTDEFRECLDKYILGIRAFDSLAVEGSEGEGLEDGREPVPFSVVKSLFGIVALEAI
jgi:hypothetical protein